MSLLLQLPSLMLLLLLKLIPSTSEVADVEVAKAEEPEEASRSDPAAAAVAAAATADDDAGDEAVIREEEERAAESASTDACSAATTTLSSVDVVQVAVSATRSSRGGVGVGVVESPARKGPWASTRGFIVIDGCVVDESPARKGPWASSRGFVGVIDDGCCRRLSTSSISTAVKESEDGLGLARRELDR